MGCLRPSQQERATQPHGSEWAGELSFDAHGATIAVRATDGRVLGALRSTLPPGARWSEVGHAADATYSLVVDSADGHHVLYENSHTIARTSELGPAIATLESAMHFQLACIARTRLFVHAGVVGWRGGAILIPGRTHAGKSTLVAALVRAGAIYYSDEYAVLDDDGRVHPFARPLGIRDADDRTHPVAPASLGAMVGDDPLPIHLVVATQYKAGARWRPRTLSRGETLLALLDNTVAARSRAADALRILGAVVTTARGIRGTRDEAAEVASRILETSPSPTHTPNPLSPEAPCSRPIRSPGRTIS